MKPAPFAYAAPDSLPEALRLLHADEDAVALAGGQSLVPMLNFRLARPSLLVDLNAIAELDRLEVLSDGALRIGALTREAVLERSGAVARGWPVLVQAIRCVAHAAIRSRGTVGGSLAHADPRAELAAALVALDARARLVSLAGERWLAVGEFLRGAMSTALEPGELVAEIEVPPVAAGSGSAFVEYARTHGDYAIAGVAVVGAPACSVSVIGAGSRPVRADRAEAAWRGGAAARNVAALAGAVARDEYRSALITALTREALEAAG